MNSPGLPATLACSELLVIQLRPTHVLITRPLEASLQLAAQLNDSGLHPIVMPLYAFSGCPPSLDMRTAWPTSAARKLAVFTSPRAVQFGLPHIPPVCLNGLEFAALGAATRKQLETAGHQVHLQARSGYTSEDLLSVPGLATVPGAAVIFCAPGGRETLAPGLTAMGWEVAVAMVYERLPLSPMPDQVDVLLGAEQLLSTWTSVSAISLAEEKLPRAAWEKILHAPALVISARIQHHLQQLGATRVFLTDGPGNTELLQSIWRLAEQSQSGQPLS